MAINTFNTMNDPAVRRAVEQGITAHREERQEHERAADERRRAEGVARAAYLAELRAKEREAAARAEAGVDAALAPRRAVERDRWLAAHPGRPGADFDNAAWPPLRAVILAEGRDAADAAARARLAARYDGMLG